MLQDASVRPHALRITLCHGSDDATFAARLARDLLNMYGEESVRLVGPTEPDERADESDRTATSDMSVMVVVLSPEALASGEIDSVLHSPASSGSDPGAAAVIAVLLRECAPPAELAGRRAISFVDAWRYDLALGQLIDAIRLSGEDATPAIRGWVD